MNYQAILLVKLRAKLLAAGFLRTYPNIPDAEGLTDDDLPLILPPDAPSLDEIIDADRGAL
ncbi:MAG: hypothetical protein KF716_11010 [Anaerolineae bacterium]|nr:hypothetical protein [Anaerolineae bacterium]